MNRARALVAMILLAGLAACGKFEEIPDQVQADDQRDWHDSVGVSWQGDVGVTSTCGGGQACSATDRWLALRVRPQSETAGANFARGAVFGFMPANSTGAFSASFDLPKGAYQFATIGYSSATSDVFCGTQPVQEVDFVSNPGSNLSSSGMATGSCGSVLRPVRMVLHLVNSAWATSGSLLNTNFTAHPPSPPSYATPSTALSVTVGYFSDGVLPGLTATQQEGAIEFNYPVPSPSATPLPITGSDLISATHGLVSQHFPVVLRVTSSTGVSGFEFKFSSLASALNGTTSLPTAVAISANTPASSAFGSVGYGLPQGATALWGSAADISPAPIKWSLQPAPVSGRPDLLHLYITVP